MSLVDTPHSEARLQSAVNRLKARGIKNDDVMALAELFCAIVDYSFAQFSSSCIKALDNMAQETNNPWPEKGPVFGSSDSPGRTKVITTRDVSRNLLSEETSRNRRDVKDCSDMERLYDDKAPKRENFERLKKMVTDMGLDRTRIVEHQLKETPVVDVVKKEYSLLSAVPILKIKCPVCKKRKERSDYNMIGGTRCEICSTCEAELAEKKVSEKPGTLPLKIEHAPEARPLVHPVAEPIVASASISTPAEPPGTSGVEKPPRRERPKKCDVPVGMKFCYKCGKTKNLDEFGNLASSKDGKSSRCRECTNIYYRNWRANRQNASLNLNKDSAQIDAVIEGAEAVAMNATAIVDKIQSSIENVEAFIEDVQTTKEEMIEEIQNPDVEEIGSPQTKFCPRCRLTKEIEEFCLNKHSKDGRNYICETCANGRLKENRTKTPAEVDVTIEKILAMEGRIPTGKPDHFGKKNTWTYTRIAADIGTHPTVISRALDVMICRNLADRKWLKEAHAYVFWLTGNQTKDLNLTENPKVESAA